MTAIGAKQELVKGMKLNSDDLTYFQEVRSGFALRPKNQDIKNKILALAPEAEKDNLKIEEACTWKSFLLRGVLKTYTDKSGTHSTDALIPEEARVRAGAKNLPTFCRKAPFGETPDTCYYFIAFGENVKAGFKLFNCSAPAELRIQQPRITQCPRCLGFHNPRGCTRIERCMKCGKPAASHKDTTANCSSPPQCANCKGAHRADAPKCHARPTIKDGTKVHPTKGQLKAIRELGQQEFLKANPPKPNEDKEKDREPEKTSAKRIRGPPPPDPSVPRGRPISRVVINVDTDAESSRESSPARSEVHVADPEGDDTMEDNPAPAWGGQDGQQSVDKW